ncbi:alpha/beta fold hydrolase [Nocardioides alcanivorans]|uniref:alpha/beta fold hydrolase n=1 Tax=Nocardioides alcanivorans TaxID=2897352 RepID=UPI001F3F66E2|nr:alpha/beta fold hydrolase [Nocardioides alcanivorans]
MRGTLSASARRRETLGEHEPADAGRGPDDMAGARWTAHRGERFGSGERGTVIFAHGIAQSRHSWRKAAAEAAEAGFASVIFDSRGHGDSDHAPGGEYSSAGNAQDLAPLLVSATAPVYLVGYSQGGDAAIEALDLDTTVSGLVLVDVAPWVEPAGVGDVQRFLEASLSGFDVADQAAAALGLLNPDQPAPPAAAVSRSLVERDGRRYWRWDPRVFDTDPDLDARGRRLDAVLTRFEVPVLLLRARESQMLSDRSVARLREVRPGAEVRVLDGVAHGVSGSTNHVYWQHIHDFITSLEGARND